MGKFQKQCEIKKSSWKKLYVLYTNFSKIWSNGIYLQTYTYVIEVQKHTREWWIPKTRIVGTSERGMGSVGCSGRFYIYKVFFLLKKNTWSKYSTMLRYDRFGRWIYQPIFLYICVLETFHNKTKLKIHPKSDRFLQLPCSYHHQPEWLEQPPVLFPCFLACSTTIILHTTARMVFMNINLLSPSPSAKPFSGYTLL